MARLNAEVYEAKRVMSGTAGEVWVDNDYLGEVTAFKASIKVDYSEILRVRNLSKGKKITSISGTGELTANHVRSFWVDKLLDEMLAGKIPSVSIIGQLDDPDAFGSERVELKNFTFEELTLMDWKNGENSEDSVSFAFTDVDFTDRVDNVEFIQPSKD